MFLIRFVAQQMFYVMKLDSRPHAWALSDEVTSIDDIDRKFGLITYYKGGSVLRMIEFFLGTETVKKGLSKYLKDLSFSSAVEEDLFIHLEAAALEDGSWPQPGVSSDLTEVLKSWTQQPGLPVVTVSRSGDASVKISQSRYQNTETPSDQAWSIPITLADLSSPGTIDWDNTVPDLWLTPASPEVSLDLSSGAIPLLNKKATGYYRVAYDEEMWREIATVLQSDYQSIHPYNRSVWCLWRASPHYLPQGPDHLRHCSHVGTRLHGPGPGGGGDQLVRGHRGGVRGGPRLH